MKSAFSRQQAKVIYGCVAAYILAYMTRLNLSATLSSIIEFMGITPASAGLLQTCFAIVYASGQLISGTIVDRVNPVRYMLLGLTGTAVCNLCMGIAGEYWMMLGLCLLNGAFQSMMWTPIVRLVAMHFPEGKTRIRANLLLSVTLAIGHLGAWGLSGFMTTYVGWRYAYIAPGGFVLLMAGVIYWVLRGAEPVKDQGKTKERAKGPSLGDSVGVFARTGFFFVMAGCVFYGFARDGIITWAPELLHALSGGDGGTSSSFSLIIPAINLMGILVGYYFRFHGGRNTRTSVALLMPLAAVFCIPLFFTSSLLPTALFMGLACATLYGINPLLTSLTPMEYDRAGCVGLAAGLIDSFIYLGSALSGFMEGIVYENAGTRGLYASWIVLALGATVLMAVSAAKRFSMDRA